MSSLPGEWYLGRLTVVHPSITDKRTVNNG